MNIQHLVGDLTALLTESKRKSSEVKHAADSAIAILKKYPAGNITTIGLDHSVDIVKPFCIAIATGNVKITTLAVPVVHKLIMAKVVPVDLLRQLLDGLREASNLAVDIQLRILQCLPLLLQNYPESMHGELLLILLGICATLTANNKLTVVINTALATLQQLFSNVFDQIPELEAGSHKVSVDDEVVIEIGDLSYEGFRIFKDLCLVIQFEKSDYFEELANVKALSVLEIVESIVGSHKSVFQKHTELAFLLRTKLVPALLRILNSPGGTDMNAHSSFPLFTRTMRVLHVLLASQLGNLEIEAEIILSFLNHLLVNSDSEQWERILVLELYKSLFSDFNTIKRIFQNYDNNPKKKNVLGELWRILNTFMHHNSYLVQESVKPFVKSIIHLSRTTSSMKISILDHLDKQEPPTVIPQTYPVYLIYNVLLSFAEGIADFVLDLSVNADASTLEADVEFTNYFIEAIYSDVSTLFKNFIYSLMDNESFHLLIRSLQRFTHATGLLGLTGLRDGLLEILSTAVIANASSEAATPSYPTSLQEQGKQLLAYGESLVESLTTTLHLEVTSTLPSRNFNNRHVTCLRALTNLAVSLGSTLQSSWKIVWITFQWCDYYIYGPDEFSGFNSKQTFPDDLLPDLSSQDLANIESSRRKLFESIADFPEESFEGLLKSLIELSGETNETEKKQETEKEVELEKRVDEHKTTSTCPYNKAFFLTNISLVCQVNSNKFVIETDDIWNLICEYFVNLGTTRTINSQLRIHIINTFSSIIKYIAGEGFGSTDKDINVETSKKSLNSINLFLNGLFKLGKPQELGILNCETELHLISLTTLHELIDKFDKHYQDSWDIVFLILNTPFKVNDDLPTKEDLSNDANLREKLRLLIDSSFDTLKLILDEFMSSLPFNHLKLLIDTLGNFCRQAYDLNISFSSISYFWLISDSLKSRMSKLTVAKFPKIKDSSELIAYIELEQSYIALDIYLLYILMGLASDSRPQVRDGAIQTFFQIIDVHGSLINKYGAWDCVYLIVLSQIFDVSKLQENVTKNKTELIQSLSLVLQGLISIFNKFAMDFSIPVFEKWAKLDKYLNNLLALGVVEINLRVFKSFQELLQPFNAEQLEHQGGEFTKIRNLLLGFWVGVTIDYDFVNPLAYQEAITTLMDSFPQLYKIVRNDFTIEECQIVLNVLNKCARYPVLPSNALDTNKPSKLQASIVKNLEVIDVSDAAIQTITIQQLSNIIVYPFALRDRIQLKLSNNVILDKVKIPTFVAMSELCIKLLKKKLLLVDDWNIIVREKGINKILKSLLQVIGNKFRGMNDEPVWIEANEILKSIVERVSKSENDKALWDLIKEDDELWALIMSVITLCFDEGDDDKYEDINMKQYKDLIELVLPKLIENQKQGPLVSSFLETVYRNSYLYEFNEVETLLNEGQDIEGRIEGYTNYQFTKYFGTTRPIVRKANVKTKLNCLHELIKFAKEPVHEELNAPAQKLLICRAAFTLRRFINDQRLLGNCPISKIQQNELVIILGGLISLDNILEQQKDNFRKLRKLLIKLVPFAGKFKGLDVWLQLALSEK